MMCTQKYCSNHTTIPKFMTLRKKARQFQNGTGLGDAGNTGACGSLVEPFMRSLAKNVTKADCEESAKPRLESHCLSDSWKAVANRMLAVFPTQSKLSLNFQMERL